VGRVRFYVAFNGLLVLFGLKYITQYSKNCYSIIQTHLLLLFPIIKVLLYMKDKERRGTVFLYLRSL
jgi:hypothetical protein